MQKPSDGAMRAARALREYIHIPGLLDEELATIIDRETRDQWILCSDRMPTEEDGDGQERVLWLIKSSTHTGGWAKISAAWDCPHWVYNDSTVGWLSLPATPEES